MADAIITEKRCRGCNTVKTAAEFNKWIRGEAGLADHCKACKKAKWKPRFYEISVAHGVCVKCGETKAAIEMLRRSNQPSGIGNVCVSCQSEVSRQRYLRNPEPVKRRVREYHCQNRDKILKRNRNRYKNDPEFRARLELINAKWRKENPERHRESQRNHLRRVRATCEKRRIRDRISAGIRISLLTGKCGSSWETLVGYTIDDLIKRLKKTIPPGYSWEDAISGKLEIDHITPVSAFHFTSPEDIDFKRCWSLSNLRLLSIFDNRSKGAKLTKPFQPSFAGI